ncbi:hypothetical protein OZL92_17215 [Bacillus sonorensis]|uniref:Phage-like protein n=1 Tax=Bacillus sonorensis L12 TaxID=1274524 RepID=M5PBR2_9BACI|nr:hypothetical protein [Bacillus sonorensis]EME72242.1 phage-like protein [Bacillus sonorensis L12]MCZ0075432.1 hypothetical protein [Bacillus sonorensis]MCZ0093086.1 hypothetical protein [Bacillus sonorensis]PAD57988.1 hypothetical protein CHH92_22355 [Bacillus sonorensis]
MSRLYNTFEFIGTLFIPNNKEKFHDITEFDSGWVKHRLNFAIQESKTNSVFVEIEGGYSKSKPNKVFSFSKGTENNKGSKLEIPWEDRLNEETVDMVADFSKIIIDLNEESNKDKLKELRYKIRGLEIKDDLTDDDKEKLSKLKQEYKELNTNGFEFIHEYDAIQFLSENLEKYKDRKFKIKGDIQYNSWQGRVFRKFSIRSMEIVSNETPSQLRATMDIFFTKDSLDEKDFKEEKKLYIDGYVLSYDNQIKKDRFFPQQLIINAQKLDFDNEMHMKRLELLKSFFKVKGKGVYHLQWEVNIFRGADEIEFTEENLTASQKEMIALGLNTLDDFKPKGGLLGESREENRLIKPILKKKNDANNFTEGAIESTYEVEDLVYVSEEPKNKEKQEKEETKPTEEEKEAAFDDLFS